MPISQDKRQEVQKTHARGPMRLQFGDGGLVRLNVYSVPKLQDEPKHANSACKNESKSHLPFCNRELRFRDISS